MGRREPWRTTTHRWSAPADPDHLQQVRRRAAELAPGGVRHLLLEVLAYAADEAEEGPPSRVVVRWHPDGSVSVADDGRGTDTRVDEEGRQIRKPVMSTRDVRFFDHPAPPVLPDGHRRRGLSVVSALSDWLVHTNRRHPAAAGDRVSSWTQRYEHGLPVGQLTALAGDGTTGTTVRFHPDPALVPPSPPAERPSPTAWRDLVQAAGWNLTIEV